MNSIKLSYGHELRRLAIGSHELSYEYLVETSKKLFPGLENYHGNSLQFAWIDEDGDRVLLSSGAELDEALRVMAHLHANTVRFEIVISIDNLQGERCFPKNDGPKAQHPGITCDECCICPVVGPRFKCTVREDFDLCEICEAKMPQPYPMIKIYTPDQAPSAIYVAIRDDAGESGPSPYGPSHPHHTHFAPHRHHGHFPHGPPHPHHGPPPHGPSHHPHGPIPHGLPHHSRWAPPPPPDYPRGGISPSSRWGRGGRGGRHFGPRRAFRKFVKDTVAAMSNGYASVAVDFAEHSPNDAGSRQSDSETEMTEVERQILEAVVGDSGVGIGGAEEEKSTDTSSVLSSSIVSAVGCPSADVPLGDSAPMVLVEEPKPLKVFSGPVVAAQEVVPVPSATASPPANHSDAYDWEIINGVNRNRPHSAQPPQQHVNPVQQFQHAFYNHAFLPRVGMQPVVSESEVWAVELRLLSSMGFFDEEILLPLLQKFAVPPVSQRPQGDSGAPNAAGIQRVVDSLLNM